MNRTTLADAALDLIQEQGLDALTMRTLAQRTGVKAASLYWHVRDRDELLDLVADSLLARVSARNGARDWRDAALAVCVAAGSEVASQRDGHRILLAVPGAVRRSPVFARLVNVLTAGAIDEQSAREIAAMMLGFVVTQPPARAAAGDRPVRGKTFTLAIDSGSRGVVVQSGGPMDTLFRVPHDPTTAAPAVTQGERVVVRRLRGGKRGEIEVNPAHPWRFQVQGPTWNTVLDLRGINVRGIHIDSSASKIECVLPAPRGVVPIHISSGVLRVALRRPPGSAVIADVAGGAFQIDLDDVRSRVTVAETHWQTTNAAAAQDRYELRISGGAARVSLDDSAPPDAPATTARSGAVREDSMSAALAIVLDGIGRHA